MGSPNLPDAPKFRIERQRLSELAEAQLGSLEDFRQESERLLARLEADLGESVSRVNPALAAQLERGSQLARAAVETGVPLLEDLRELATRFDVADREARARATAIADTLQAGDQQREAALQRLARLGVDPSQVRATALDRALRVEIAARAAANANVAAGAAENRAAQLLTTALAGAGALNQLGNAAISQGVTGELAQQRNLALPLQARIGALGSAPEQAQLAQRAVAGTAALDMARFNAKMQRANLKAQSRAAAIGGVSELVGTGVGAAIGFGAL